MSKRTEEINRVCKRAVDLLHSLGNTPSVVAQSLKRLGIVGDIGESASCPLANYLSHEGIDAEVEGDNVKLNLEELALPDYEEDEDADDNYVYFSNSRAGSVFVTQFDGEEFEFLIDGYEPGDAAEEFEDDDDEFDDDEDSDF